MHKSLKLPFDGLCPHKAKTKTLLLSSISARFYHTKAPCIWLDEYEDDLVLEFLLPHSSKRKHIEQVWELLGLLRIYNQYFDNLKNLYQAVFGRVTE